MKLRILNILIISGIIVLAWLVLRYFHEPENVFHPDKYIQVTVQDSLLVDMVTYMGMKPRYADHQTRHLPEYRSFYVGQATGFNLSKYFVDDNEMHYFYVIRPARDPLGDRRAIGGRMRLDEHYQIIMFEELFATRVMEERALLSVGRLLFRAMIMGDSTAYLLDRKMIEWPDDRCRYDKIMNEWRYDVLP